MALVASGVKVVYSKGEPDEIRALDDVSLNVPEGEFVLIAGRSGSGKSTLLQCLSGLLRPASGKISLDGADAGKSRKLIGLAVQFPERALFEKTLYDDIAFGPRNMGMREDEVNEKVMAAIKITGLDVSLLKGSPRSLSHGQKRLAALAGRHSHKAKISFSGRADGGPGYRRQTSCTGCIIEPQPYRHYDHCRFP